MDAGSSHKGDGLAGAYESIRDLAARNWAIKPSRKLDEGIKTPMQAVDARVFRSLLGETICASLSLENDSHKGRLNDHPLGSTHKNNGAR